jgi:nucleoside-diphosphate-sugar epimerase
MSPTERVALVTGATGFLGGRLADRLKLDHRVVALVRGRAQASACGFEPSDVISLEDVDWRNAVIALQPDAVFHCAAWSGMTHGSGQVGEIVDANIGFGTEILECLAALPSPPPFVWAATFWQFADGEDYRPNSLYAATKQAFADIAAYYRRMRGCPAMGLVLFDVYGDRDPRARLLTRVAHAVRARRSGEKSTPVRLSSGTQDVDFVHVDDAASAFLLAAESLSGTAPPPNLLYGVAGNNRASLRDTVDGLLDGEDDDLIAWDELPPRIGEIMTYPGLQNLPGWAPTVSLEDGFRGLVDRG